MLWKLQFNSESVSERIDHFRRPSSYVFSTKSDEITFFRYLHEQSYFLKKKSSQSHQPSWRVMLWKLQFNSECVSERISHFWRPSSHVFSTEMHRFFLSISSWPKLFVAKNFITIAWAILACYALEGTVTSSPGLEVTSKCTAVYSFKPAPIRAPISRVFPNLITQQRLSNLFGKYFGHVGNDPEWTSRGNCYSAKS